MLNIGHSLLENGAQSSLKELFAERESCQKNPICNKWLDCFFKQSNKSTQNKEHAAYMDQLKKAHGKS